MVSEKNPESVQWLEGALAQFESDHPGLLAQLSSLTIQNQIKMLIYPVSPSGGSSSSTTESYCEQW